MPYNLTMGMVTVALVLLFTKHRWATVAIFAALFWLE